MASVSIIEKNLYYDSVTLMSLSGKVLQLEGVEQAIISMATEMNKDLLRNIGMLTEDVEQATENDLMIVVKADTEERLSEVITFIHDELNKKKTNTKKEENDFANTLYSALNMLPDANIAVISVPGQYAAREAKQALKKGLHVMIFSDNVSLEEEIELKKMGRELGLLVMGPDCGTAMINHVGLCFANEVSSGGIGIVAASGTGLQEVAVQIDRLGYGISHAIGTGGRDLHEKIGGIMMLEGLKALEEDDSTEVITLVSKPPAPSVQEEILHQVENCKKPVVVCFLDGDMKGNAPQHVEFASTLFDAAKKSIKSLNPEMEVDSGIGEDITNWMDEEKARMDASQKFIRGLYCGGTLTSETVSVIRSTGLKVKSNVAKKEEEKLLDIKQSIGHTLLDLGDDDFTRGKPHPMIDPTLRNQRIIQEARDPETAVLLLDFVLGYGSNDDPVGVTIDTLIEAKKIAKENGRNLPIIAYICGTMKDKQNFHKQEESLKAIGAYVAESNEQAARIAAMLVR